MRIWLVLPLVVAGGALHLAASDGASQSFRASEAVLACKKGSVRGLVIGRQQCLRPRARCNRRYDRIYHRYRFHCHTGRLSRARAPRPSPQPVPPPASAPAPAPPPARPSPPDGVIVFAEYPRDGAYEHYDGPLPRPEPTYRESPPVGGDHAEYWARCKFFEEPVVNVLTVHSLEHGAVWLAYRPDLSTEDLAVLRGFVDGEREILASPYPGLTKPLVAVAWARQLPLDSVRDPRLVQFIEAFHDAAHSPQAFIDTCDGQVG